MGPCLFIFTTKHLKMLQERLNAYWASEDYQDVRRHPFTSFRAKWQLDNSAAQNSRLLFSSLASLTVSQPLAAAFPQPDTLTLMFGLNFTEIIHVIMWDYFAFTNVGQRVLAGGASLKQAAYWRAIFLSFKHSRLTCAMCESSKSALLGITYGT